MLLFPMDPVCWDTLKKYNHNMGNRRLNRFNQYPAAQFASPCFLYQRLCQFQYQFNVKLVAFVTIYMEEQVPTCLPVCKTQIEYLVNVIINVLPSYSRCCCFHCNYFFVLSMPKSRDKKVTGFILHEILHFSWNPWLIRKL